LEITVGLGLAPTLNWYKVVDYKIQSLPRCGGGYEKDLQRSADLNLRAQRETF